MPASAENPTCVITHSLIPRFNHVSIPFATSHPNASIVVAVQAIPSATCISLCVLIVHLAMIQVISTMASLEVARARRVVRAPTLPRCVAAVAVAVAVPVAVPVAVAVAVAAAVQKSTVVLRSK